MCEFKSGIILKNRIVLAPEGNESHSDLLKSLNIEDNYTNASRMFVRAELTPPNDNRAIPVESWIYKVDQDVVPDWYEEDPRKYEQEFREKVKDYIKEQNLNIICGYAWIEVKDEDNNVTYYFMNGYLNKSDFSRSNNNYADSKIRKDLNNSDLAKELKEKFGDNLVPITTNLLSLDGLDDYGTVEGDILAVPTFDLYRKFRKQIPNINICWWLATPWSTPSGYGSGSVACVGSSGRVNCSWYNNSRAVRPFFIVKSSNL